MLPPMRTRVLVLVGAVLLVGCGGGKTCTPSPNQVAQRFCVPDGGAQGVALSLELVESCGGCTQYATGCSVSVSGDVITLSLDGEACTLPLGTACPAVCSQKRVTCAVGPLDAGTWTVKANTSPPSSRTLVVAAQGETACTN